MVSSFFEYSNASNWSDLKAIEPVDILEKLAMKIFMLGPFDYYHLWLRGLEASNAR